MSSLQPSVKWPAQFVKLNEVKLKSNWFFEHMKNWIFKIALIWNIEFQLTRKPSKSPRTSISPIFRKRNSNNYPDRLHPIDFDYDDEFNMFSIFLNKNTTAFNVYYTEIFIDQNLCIDFAENAIYQSIW